MIKRFDLALGMIKRFDLPLGIGQLMISSDEIACDSFSRLH